MSDKSEPVTFEKSQAVAESTKALLCIIDDEEYWIPKSQIHEDSEVSEVGDEGDLIISEWLAIEKGLV